MKPIEFFKNSGIMLLSVAGLLFIVFVFSIVIKGAVWLTETVEPILVASTSVAVWCHILILLPLSVPRSIRSKISGPIGLMTLLYVITAAFKASVVLYSLWGLPGWLLGVFLGGVGIFPASMIAAAMKGLWGDVGSITLLLVLAFVSSIHMDWTEK